MNEHPPTTPKSTHRMWRDPRFWLIIGSLIWLLILTINSYPL